jgi:hypothetical protein
MKNTIKHRWILFMGILMALSLACATSPIISSIPTFPPSPPTPGTSNVPTGSSPISGDWNAYADFGRFAFTIDPDGLKVTTAVLELSNWTCGGTTITTGIQELDTRSVTDGEFSVDFSLDSGRRFHTIAFNGTYDAAKKKFSGTWTEDNHSKICSGAWESVARK